MFCFLDLMYQSSEEEFYNHFAARILKATSNKMKEFIHLAGKLIRGARISINTGTGESELELGIRYIRENAEAILNLPQALARKKWKKIIVCVNEFQNISRFEEHVKIQRRLRSMWQHHKDDGYLLYGT